MLQSNWGCIQCNVTFEMLNTERKRCSSSTESMDKDTEKALHLLENKKIERCLCGCFLCLFIYFGDSTCLSQRLYFWSW